MHIRTHETAKKADPTSSLPVPASSSASADVSGSNTAQTSQATSSEPQTVNQPKNRRAKAKKTQTASVASSSATASSSAPETQAKTTVEATSSEEPQAERRKRNKKKKKNNEPFIAVPATNPEENVGYAASAPVKQGQAQQAPAKPKATPSKNEVPLAHPAPVATSSSQIIALGAIVAPVSTPSKGDNPNSTENRNRTAQSLARGIASTPKHGTPKSKQLLTPIPAQAADRSAITPAHYNRRVARNQQVYPEYMTLEKAREEVAAGRAWEGVLRANPNASRMCFFTIPGRVKDVMVKDEWLNRAFPGDTVIITMLTEEDLKTEEGFQARRNNRRGGSNAPKKDSKDGGKDASTSSASNGKNVASTDSNSASSSAAALPNTQSSSSSAPSHGLRSEDLKGIEDDDHETRSDYSRDDTSLVDEHDQKQSELSDDDDDDADRPTLVGVPHDNASISQRLVVPASTLADANDEKKPTEAELAQLEAEMSALNVTTHATFSASLFGGILEEDKPKSELAKVIHIVNPFHESIGYVGQLRRRSDGGFELRPLAAQHPIFDVPAPDSRYLADIPDYAPPQRGGRSKKSKKEEDENTQLFITYFRRWNVASRRPLGEKPEWIGEAGDVEAEIRAITSTHMIDTRPHDASLSAMYGTSTEINLESAEASRRKDLRKTRIFTVDPPTARDIDDALSIEKIDENRYRVGVHIADVSHYVFPGSPLDKIAQERSTSVYMVNTMYPMLPPALSENLCSLNPKVDRYAFSVLWDLDAEGNILGNEWIGRTIIRSCAKLSYTDAQIVIDAHEKDGDLTPAIEHLKSKSPEHTPESIAEDILNLNKLAQSMRARRFSGGALRLSRLRLHFELGLDGYPIDAHPYYIKESNQLIEEFMLLANMSVAKFIYKAFPQSALLRSHPAPKEDMLESFGYLMKALNIPFDTSSSGSLYTSLSKLEDWQHRPVEELVTKAMNAAIYISTGTISQVEELWHYALNVPFYTHFTSPIRRYPDIVVHRQIQAAIDKMNGTLKEGPEALLEKADPCHDPAWVSEVSNHSNERKRSSRKAQDDSIKLFACLYLKKAPYVDEESIVLDVARNKLVVFSPQLCMRIKIEIAEKKGYYTRFDSHSRVLSVFEQPSKKCLLALTYFSKVSTTYFTKGRMPMDVGAELTIFYKPPTSKEKDQALRAASAPPTSANIASSSRRTPAKKARGATPSKTGRGPASSSNTPNPHDGSAKNNRNKNKKERQGLDGEVRLEPHQRPQVAPSTMSTPGFADDELD